MYLLPLGQQGNLRGHNEPILYGRQRYQGDTVAVLVKPTAAAGR